ncbi:MAG: Mfa1 fimbrilin C-terminal domain-containing protein [Parabacteroides sp.]|nr:Mfa1 fimbrilin C-terminal domain-containing protein [Parabacteroides sp.]
MVAEDQVEDRITSVIVSAIYAPPGFKYGDSYFRYNNIAISLEQILWYKNTSFPLPTELEGLKEAIADLETNRGTTIDHLLQESFNECDIEYFKDGVNYYRIPIQHFGDQLKGAYGYYGVVGNNQYNITINSLTGPGSIGGGTASYMSADIKV